MTESTPTDSVRIRNRLVLLLLAAVFLFPVLASLILFQIGWRPESTKNYGTIVVPARPLKEISLVDDKGSNLTTKSLGGKWAMIYFAPKPCDRPCEAVILRMKQVHVALGKNQSRLQRIVVSTSLSPSVTKTMSDAYAPSLVISGGDLSSFAAEFVSGDSSAMSAGGFIYLVDPLNNFMMTYPADGDATKIRRDLGRLMHVSQIG